MAALTQAAAQAPRAAFAGGRPATGGGTGGAGRA